MPPLPTPAQQTWQDCELGLVYHFDIPVYLPNGWAWEPAYRTVLDPSDYNPAHLDTDQWLEAAKAIGAGYAVFTATHMGGFRQWPSERYPYGVLQSPWRGGKGDVVCDFVESCRRCGIKPGLYVSVRFNAHWQVSTSQVNFGAGGDDAKQAAYLRSCEEMVEELCSRYGDLVEFWFDGGAPTPAEGGPDVQPIFEKHQPNAVYYHSRDRADHRWAGNEQGTVGDPCYATVTGIDALYNGSWDARRPLLQHGDPDGRAWSPAMADAPIRNHEWFWRPNDEHKIYSTRELVDMYYRSVGRNATLIMGATPNRDGLIPDADMARYKQFGREICRRFARPVAETSGQGEAIELTLPAPARIEHVVVMEDIAQGERVRGHEIDALTPSNHWQTIATGTSIGHKRIHHFPAVEVTKLRLRCTHSVNTPVVRRLAAYRAT